MELIVSHNNTDFDGLAAMVAASKLHPEASMVIEGKPSLQVREFLALHKDTLPILDVKSINLEEVTAVILVDTRSPSRVGSVAKLLARKDLTIYIYDHHPSAPSDIKGTCELVEQIGAVTTLLVELLRQKRIGITAFEATLLALGIYEDTGNLLFESTTSRDAAALSFLLESGANLSIIGDFMDRPLSGEQKSLLNTLLTSSRHYLVKGIKVLITSTSIEQFVGGLALLTHKVNEIENLDLIFTVVKMEDRVHIVARGKGKSVAVNEILREFGGAGHAKAASATVKNGDVNQIVSRILDFLEERVIPETCAREIMSKSVKCIAGSCTIEQARNILLRYGHTGLPVLEEEKLAGIISRRDVDKALHHGLGHAPVRGYMSRKVITVNPEASVSEIEELMITHDIGRLPVVELGKLVGIISRSDVLRTLHGQAVPVNYRILRQRSRVQSLEILRLIEALPLEVRDLFRLVQVLGQEQGVKVFVVGGFVRDLLLGSGNSDIDLVVEGDAVSFAQLLADKLKAKACFHPHFGTATLETAEGLNLDVVTARTEYYDYPASLPKVESSSLKQDLYRRDFTVNAMAIELDAEGFGSLKDYYGGYRDLEQGEIRILHNLSFVDDPTRILRAFRFEQRLNFSLEPQTLLQLQKAVHDGLLGKLSRDRLRNELILILKEPAPGKVLDRLQQMGVWESLLPQIPAAGVAAKFAQVREAIGWLEELGLWSNGLAWQANLLALVGEAEPAAALSLLEGMHFERRLLSLVEEFLERKLALKGFLAKEGELVKGVVHRLLHKMPKELVASLLAVPELGGGIKAYLLAWSKTKVIITGRDLKALRISPGPVYGRILSALWDARLEGTVNTKDEEIALVQSIIEEETDARPKHQ